MTGEILLLGTLHQMHHKMAFYTLDDLHSIVGHVHPDVLCVELSQSMLEKREWMEHKVESFDVLLPYADEHGCPLVPLEPDGARRSEILELQRGAYSELEKSDPRAEALFGEFANLFYDLLFSSWESVLDVHSEATQALIRLKHAYQDRVFSQGEAAGWEAWNVHILEQIEAAAVEYPQARILVCVGVEHLYWLQGRIVQEIGLRMVDMRRALEGWAG